MENNEKEIEEIVTVEEDMNEKDNANNVNNNKEESREFYVYKHIRKDNNTCFYVGKGKDRRIKVPKRNKHYNRIRKKHGCYVVKIKENLTEKEAFALEREIIEDYVFVFGYGINIDGYRDYSHEYLTNCTWGGEGCSGLNPYANKTEEEMEEIGKKISEKNKGEKNPMYGKTGENNPMYGKNPFENKTEEEMEEIGKKISEKLKGENNTMYGKTGENSPMYGKNAFENKTSEEMEEIGKKISEKLSKKVICITTGETFDSIKEAENHYNIGNISKCCNGKYKHAGKLKDGTKLQWKYSEDYDNDLKAV